MTANTTFVSGAILTAAQMNALPWGIVDTTSGGTSGRGFVNKSDANFAIQSPFGSATQITGFTMTFTPVTGRLYKASYSVRVEVVTAQTIYTQFRIGATQYAARADSIPASGNDTITNFVILSGLTASTTLKVFAAAETTSVGSTLVADATAINTFCIEDIGPST